MNKWWQQLTQSSAKQSAAAGSSSYWLGSAVVALGGGGYVVYRLWDQHRLGAIILAVIFALVAIYDLRLVLAKRRVRRRR